MILTTAERIDYLHRSAVTTEGEKGGQLFIINHYLWDILMEDMLKENLPAPERVDRCEATIATLMWAPEEE